MNDLYLYINGDTTIILPVPLEVVGYGCGMIEMNGKVVSDKANKRRLNKENYKADKTANENDGVNGETDKPTDEILPNNHDEPIAEGNDSTDLTLVIM